MDDFFISYTNKDRAWAEWIAFTLEEAGFTTKIQAWDFQPGSNFVLEMQDAAKNAKRTVLVLSPDYLNSKMAASEWAAAFARDPQGQERRIVPVMVHECQTDGLLPTIVQIRIYDLSEDAARKEILTGIDKKRAKPTTKPKFPGQMNSHDTKSFPSYTESPAVKQSSVLPNFSAPKTDHDIRKFIKNAYATIRDGFRERLEQAEQENDRISIDFTENTATEFQAELFLDGKSKCFCRIFLGNMFGLNGISYSQDRSTGHSANEILRLSEDNTLALSASFSSSANNMTENQAVDYLWDSFIHPLQFT